MRSTTVVDAITPVFTDALSDGARLHLTGTLRHQRDQYLIEQQLPLDTGGGLRWTTPRVHRIMATDAMADALRARIDQVVTITGRVGGGDTRNRNRTAIIVDQVQPLELTPNG